MKQEYKMNSYIIAVIILLSATYSSLSQEKSDLDFSTGKEPQEVTSEYSITQDQINNISNQCASDTECIDDKCEVLYPDSRLFSIRCFANVREYQKETIPKETRPRSKWSIQRSSSAMDDSKTVSLILDADNYIDAYYNKSEKPTLIIRCRENKTEIYIRTNVSANPELGLYNEFTVRIRLDEGKPFKQRWSESTDGKALFAPRSIALAKKISQSKIMLFEFTPYNSNSQLADFDVQGLEPYLKELAETCNWKL